MASSSRLPHKTLSPTNTPYDDDEDYDSFPSHPQTPTIHPCPIFHTTDPAFHSAYSFSDSLGRTYPETPAPKTATTLEPTYVDDEEGATESSTDEKIPKAVQVIP